jgi:hypothetical protein
MHSDGKHQGAGAGLGAMTPQQLRELACAFWNASPATDQAAAILAAAWCVIDEALARAEDQPFQRFLAAAKQGAGY